MSSGMEKKEMSARGKNFTSEEVLLLAELVGKYRSVIENKQSGAITHKQKETAWNNLSMKFNAKSNGKYRTSKMLLNKWRNTKKTLTKNYSANKKSIYKTGGGAKETNVVLETPVDAYVHDIIGARMTGNNAICDSDYVVANGQVDKCEPTDLLVVEMDVPGCSGINTNVSKQSISGGGLNERKMFAAFWSNRCLEWDNIQLFCLPSHLLAWLALTLLIISK